jgi:death on curing protein
LKEPVFLRLDEVLVIHDDQIKRYGGRPGIRDIALLKSAIAMPAAGFGGEYLQIDIYEMAAAYLFHIIRNHPFVDGNKRTGAISAVVFLIVNGIELNVGENIFEEIVISAAEGTIDKPAVAQLFRKNAIPAGQET